MSAMGLRGEAAHDRYTIWATQVVHVTTLPRRSKIGMNFWAASMNSLAGICSTTAVAQRRAHNAKLP